MTCAEAIAAYGLRALGLGERLLPSGEITLCQQVALIGSGLIWNLYFAGFALLLGFFLATGLALAKTSHRRAVRLPAAGFIYLFRGTPLFIQFFFAYELFVQVPRAGFQIDLGVVVIGAQTAWLTKAWAGALLVLFLNTSAYTAEIFNGALRAVPRGDVEAAMAIGMTPAQRFRRVIWPTMLRLAWPAYTNEAIFLFHATALVFFSSFPTWRQEGDALYYANYFAEKTFNPFVAYPIAAGYFVLATLILIAAFGLAGRILNRHVAPEQRRRFRFRPEYVR
ncbi:ABC transporter permease subunit [Rhodobacteraceae bacterium 2CG4]|uniref:ABC transporter permease subunit n=1 Tax=Halovulum marinum TaxID=2662447 RepID=A0A6L5YVI0_9RHOB|nr:ABC transporter permease subunit [Halovulum marinum]MSU88070.1 ABC transporter permease subunit [Halovulum marinum]